MTNDYLNEFTPDWPHGHVVVLSDGTVKPFVVKVTDAPGDWYFRADGGNVFGEHLRNVAPPKHRAEDTK